MTFIGIGMLNCFRTLADPEWQDIPAIMASISYIIFYISDTLVSVSVLIKDSWLISLSIITTYHIAQLGIVFGILLNNIPFSDSFSIKMFY